MPQDSETVPAHSVDESEKDSDSGLVNLSMQKQQEPGKASIIQNEAQQPAIISSPPNSTLPESSSEKTEIRTEIATPITTVRTQISDSNVKSIEAGSNLMKTTPSPTQKPVEKPKDISNPLTIATTPPKILEHPGLTVKKIPISPVDVKKIKDSTSPNITPPKKEKFRLDDIISKIGKNSGLTIKKTISPNKSDSIQSPTTSSALNLKSPVTNTIVNTQINAPSKGEEILKSSPILPSDINVKQVESLKSELINNVEPKASPLNLENPTKTEISNVRNDLIKNKELESDVQETPGGASKLTDKVRQMLENEATKSKTPTTVPKKKELSPKKIDIKHLESIAKRSEIPPQGKIVESIMKKTDVIIKKVEVDIASTSHTNVSTKPPLDDCQPKSIIEDNKPEVKSGITEKQKPIKRVNEAPLVKEDIPPPKKDRSDTPNLEEEPMDIEPNVTTFVDSPPKKVDDIESSIEIKQPDETKEEQVLESREETAKEIPRQTRSTRGSNPVPTPPSREEPKARKRGREEMKSEKKPEVSEIIEEDPLCSKDVKPESKIPAKVEKKEPHTDILEKRCYIKIEESPTLEDKRRTRSKVKSPSPPRSTSKVKNEPKSTKPVAKSDDSDEDDKSKPITNVQNFSFDFEENEDIPLPQIPTRTPKQPSTPKVTPKSTPKPKPPATTSGGHKKKKRDELDSSLILQEDADSETPVRQSRRIAQLKIREEAERRKLEEMVLKKMKEESNKKKKEEGKFVKSESEAEIPEEEDSESEKKLKSKIKKKKKDRSGRPWQTDSSDEDEEDDQEEEDGLERRYIDDEAEPRGKMEELKSDHEFSPESDMEADAEYVPTRRARTAKKQVPGEEESSSEEENPEHACQKCKKHDHPEWILLCDSCDKGYHCSCLTPVLFIIPEGDWFCPKCQHLKLIENLNSYLQSFEKMVKQKELEEIRKQRIAYTSINVENMLATTPKKKTQVKKAKGRPPPRRRNLSESESESASGKGSDSESGSDSGSSRSKSSKSSSGNTSDDEPIYKLRKRRQVAMSYRFNEYDDLINSAIKDEVDKEKGAGNLGRGKDISTIIEAEEERERLKDSNSEQQKDDEQVEDNTAPGENEESEEEIRRPKVKQSKLKKRKSRKLNSLDIESEDEDSDEDFQGSSSDSDEEDYSISAASEDSFDLSRKMKKSKHERRSRRRRRADAMFINDNSDDSEEVVRKTRKRKKKVESDFSDEMDDDDEDEEDVDSADLCETSNSDSDTDDSDGAWKPSKKNKTKSKAKAKPPPKAAHKVIRIKKKRADEGEKSFKAGVSGKKPKAKYNSDSEDSDGGELRRTRGRRTVYIEDFDESDSDDGIKPGVKRPDTPPEEREQFIKKQEEIKRMLAAKNTDAAKAMATPVMKPMNKGVEPPLDSISTVPLQVIQNAKVLDVDYHIRKGTPVTPTPAPAQTDFSEDFDELPEDFDPEDMDEDDITKMMEEEDFAQYQLKLAGETIRNKRLKDEMKRKNEEMKTKQPLAPPSTGHAIPAPSNQHPIPPHTVEQMRMIRPPLDQSMKPRDGAMMNRPPPPHLVSQLPPHMQQNMRPGMPPGMQHHMRPHHPMHPQHMSRMPPHHIRPGTQHLPQTSSHLPQPPPLSRPPPTSIIQTTMHQRLPAPPHMHMTSHQMPPKNMQQNPMNMHRTPHPMAQQIGPHPGQMLHPGQHPPPRHGAPSPGHPGPHPYPGPPPGQQPLPHQQSPSHPSSMPHPPQQHPHQPPIGSPPHIPKPTPPPTSLPPPSSTSEPIIPTTVLSHQSSEPTSVIAKGPEEPVKKRGRRKKITPLRDPSKPNPGLADLSVGGAAAAAQSQPPTSTPSDTKTILADRLTASPGKINLKYTFEKKKLFDFIL